MLAALALVTLQIAGLHAALGMKCPRSSSIAMATSDEGAVLTAAGAVPGDHAPHAALSSGCPASTCLPETGVAATPELPPDAAAFVSAARPAPDPSFQPPFHPPRSV